MKTKFVSIAMLLMFLLSCNSVKVKNNVTALGQITVMPSEDMLISVTIENDQVVAVSESWPHKIPKLVISNFRVLSEKDSTACQ